MEIINAFTPIFENDEFFKSKAAMYVYSLTELSGSERCNALKITRLHYHFNDIATKWKNEIAQCILQSGDNFNGKAADAMIKLYDLYNNMTNHASDTDDPEPEPDLYDSILLDNELIDYVEENGVEMNGTKSLVIDNVEYSIF